MGKKDERRDVKRIGVITIKKCNNYGADLQAFALGAMLHSFGYDVENMDYLFHKHPRHHYDLTE